MKTLTKISLAALSMAIAACSSGGGGSKNSAPKPKVEQKQELKQGQKQQAPKSDADKSKQNTPKSDVNEPKKNGPQLEGNDLLQGVPKTEGEPKSELNAPKQPEPKSELDTPKQPEPKSELDTPKQPEPKTGLDAPKQPEPKSELDAPKQPEPKSELDTPKQPEPKSELDVPKQLEPKSKLDESKSADTHHTVNGKSYTSTLTEDKRFNKLDFNPKVISSENITQLIIDGETFDVSANGSKNSRYTVVKDGQFLSNDDKFSNIKYGRYQLKDNQLAYFVQGIPTKHSEIPQQGTFNYEGSYISYGAPEGVATFKADFGEKRLTGELKGFYPGGSSYGLGAIIEGNHFHSRRGTVNVDGHFYGKDADELAGFVEDEAENHLSIFGGKKVDSSTK
ncbi:transferrin-binding protein-like solute binding protein [Actinobacillus equuli]|uniref:transferrin-binding protein-like solute binding protein n=1 Tax=Actinobacillus equuli TaxID=718 RepID=UPI002441ACA0|nr:transferrin-binding protein-like solute binding protein [Actinobacillus equuli]WGE57981.1 transferrin-binding protein-like solute binding protein [Actinobacillus equuli subsp. equuli]